MVISRMVCLVTAPLIVVACAPEPAPRVVYGQPIYDKYGTEIVGCESGIYVPGAPVAEQCAPPPDGCDPQSTAAAVDPNCRPRGRDDNYRSPGANPQRGGPTTIP